MGTNGDVMMKSMGFSNGVNTNHIKSKGQVIAVQGPVVDVKFPTAEDVPNIFTIIHTQTVDKDEVVLEVAEHLPANTARCIAINSTINLQRNTQAYATGDTIQIPAGEALFGRIINILGEPIDKKGKLQSLEKFNIRKKRWEARLNLKKQFRKVFWFWRQGLKLLTYFFLWLREVRLES